jgi:hypothetical protein
LKRTKFLEIFAPQFQKLPFRTCLCNACADGRECFKELEIVISGKEVPVVFVGTRLELRVSFRQLKVWVNNLLPLVKGTVSNKGSIYELELEPPRELFNFVFEDRAWSHC